MASTPKPHLLKQEGGLRTLPDYHEVAFDTPLPKVTIITVVYNGAAHLEATVRSIINQSYPHTEYIVVDGGSTDGTLDILWRYNSYIDYWVSESDNGLYHAMNKGLALGTGDYVWFVNAGDEIFDLETLSDIFAHNKAQADVYYGETLLIDQKGQPIGMRRLQAPASLTWRDLRHGMLVSHQAFVVRAHLAVLYDTRFRFSADFDWMLRVLKTADTVHNTELILAKFMDGGLTKKNIQAGLKERFGIMRRHFGLWPTLWRHVYMSLRFGLFVAKHRRF